MSRPKNPLPRQATTLHIERGILRALRMKAAATGVSISSQANEAFRRSLADEDRRLKVFAARRKQSVRPYEDFLAELKRHGQI
jgi:plasmid stability protein